MSSEEIYETAGREVAGGMMPRLMSAIMSKRIKMKIKHAGLRLILK